MNQISEIINKIEEATKWICLEAPEEVYADFSGIVRNNLQKLKELTSWAKYDEANKPDKDKLYAVKRSYYIEDPVIGEEEIWEHYIAYFQPYPSTDRWFVASPSDVSFAAEGTLFKEVE